MKDIIFFAVLIFIALPLSIAIGQAAGNVDRSRGELKKALFAGGCFWCMEKPFEQLAGVESVVSGYTGGSSDTPTYKDYISGGHLEVVEISYDPAVVSYEKLLEIYWRQVDPTDDGGQFVDRGSGYVTAIYYLDDEQKRLANESKANLEEQRIFDKPIVTPILPSSKFYPAEDYHQDYYRKNPLRYKIYRIGSGRDQFLKKTWKNEKTSKNGNKEDLRQRLTPLQYYVTQEEGTEPAFDNAYWDNKEEGLYVDIVSGEPLFSSLDKFKSGTGWPSFTKPLVTDNVVEKEDLKLFRARTELRSRQGDSHLGHVFGDGPAPTGRRYCLNSAALRFIPVKDLEKEGYGEFLSQFENK